MDKYATHLPVLEKIFEYEKYPKVYEYGMGFHSTPFFIKNCEEIFSHEMQSVEWFEKCDEAYFKNEHWIGQCEIGPYILTSGDISYDLVFVDGHGDCRPECINNAPAMQAKVIVAHDTEEKGYGWERVNLPAEYHSIQILDKETGIGTTVWALDKGLIEYLKVLL